MYTLKERISKTLDIYRVYITVIVLYLMKFIRIIKKKIRSASAAYKQIRNRYKAVEEE